MIKHDIRYYKKTKTVKLYVSMTPMVHKEKKQSFTTPDALRVFAESKNCQNLKILECVQHSLVNNYNPKKYTGTWIFSVKEVKEERNGEASHIVLRVDGLETLSSLSSPETCGRDPERAGD